MTTMAEIPKRALGRTGLSISVLGLGGAPLGELFQRMSEAQAEAIVQTAFDQGIDYFDTDPWYGHGLSEHRMGHCLRQQERSRFVLSTKAGRVYSRPHDLFTHTTAPWVGGLPFELRFDYSHDGILRSYEDSLQRLGMNQVDLLVIHDLDSGYHDPGTLEHHRRALEESGWSALEALRATGAIRGIGAGINDDAMMAYFLDRFDPDFFLVAMPYTLLDQRALHGAFRRCEQRGIEIVIGAPFASGILATGPVEGAVYSYATAPREILDKTRRIQAVCDAYSVTLQAAALQFPLAHSCVTAVIPGATEPRFVSDNISSMLAPIPAALWQALKDEALIDGGAPVPQGY